MAVVSCARPSRTATSTSCMPARTWYCVPRCVTSPDGVITRNGARAPGVASMKACPAASSSLVRGRERAPACSRRAARVRSGDTRSRTPRAIAHARGSVPAEMLTARRTSAWRIEERACAALDHAVERLDARDDRVVPCAPATASRRTSASHRHRPRRPSGPTATSARRACCASNSCCSFAKARSRAAARRRHLELTTAAPRFRVLHPSVACSWQQIPHGRDRAPRARSGTRGARAAIATAPPRTRGRRGARCARRPTLLCTSAPASLRTCPAAHRAPAGSLSSCSAPASALSAAPSGESHRVRGIARRSPPRRDSPCEPRRARLFRRDPRSRCGRSSRARKTDPLRRETPRGRATRGPACFAPHLRPASHRRAGVRRRNDTNGRSTRRKTAARRPDRPPAAVAPAADPVPSRRQVRRRAARQSIGTGGASH